MSDFMTFRRMVTPYVIEVLFWLACVAVVVAGLVLFVLGLHERHRSESLTGLGCIVLGPLVVRIYAEILIVIFRINATLTDLRALAIWAAERAHAAAPGNDEPPLVSSVLAAGPGSSTEPPPTGG